MLVSTLYLLQKYFEDNRTQIENILATNNSTSELYRTIIGDAISSIQSEYLYGSSLSEIDMDGNVLFAYSGANFGETKEEIKKIRGSVQKIGNREFLIADTKNQRAVIIKNSYVSLGNSESKILDDDFLKLLFNNANVDINASTYNVIWQYNSDRFISSFKIVKPNFTINVYDGSTNPEELSVRQNSYVTFINSSTQPINIYSGYTTLDLFNANPDLSLYGQDFSSPSIPIGGEWTLELNKLGKLYWFVYPNIITGDFTVVDQEVTKDDYFLICENDGTGLPLTSRIIKVDYNKNITWSFGNNYLINPKSANTMYNNKVLIST